MLGVLCLLLVIVLILCWTLVQKRFSYFRDRGILYVKPTFPLGNIGHLKKIEDFNGWSKELYFKFRGRAVLGGVFFCLNPQLVVTDLDVIRDILDRDFNCFPDHGIYFGDDINKRDPLMPSLYTLRGEMWRHMRTKLSPAFSFKMSEKFDPVNECAMKLCDYVRVMSEERPINAKDISLRYICDVLGSSIFGIDSRGMLDKEPVLLDIAHRIYNPNQGELLMFLIYSCFNWDLLNGQYSTKYTRKFVRVIDEVVKFREDNNLRRNDIMQVFLDINRNNKMIVDDESGELMGLSTGVHGEAYFLFCFGYHNTRTILSSALFELASNQSIQCKARDEIIRVLNESDSLNYKAVDRMVYLQQIVDETLRKYPGTSHLERMANEDYITRKGRHFIKKGTSIIIPVFGIHNDPLIYPEPERFNPDRMAKDQVKLRHPNSFMPFGGGPRVCIGQRFVFIQVKLAIIQLLCNFQLSVHNWTKQPINVNFDATSDKDIWLDVQPL